MRNSAKLILVASLVIGLCPVRADDKPPESCGNLPTGLEQKQCSETEYRQAAEELKAVYARTLESAVKADARRFPAKGSSETNSAVTIANSQRAWEAYRDAECRGVVGQGGGSARMVWVLGCLAEKTSERTRELNAPYDQR